MVNTQLKCPNCGENAIERSEGEPTWDEGIPVACTDLENCACGHLAIDCDCILHKGEE
ncbi:hypothetical protein LCGC14_0644180 [marine sediment metagenome]|uniref:Uncharacterized protein n=1 Tax=marine sediment metagenome TaxID=412755 RepID=A0A0F9R3H9_9ZZZZ